MLLSFGFSCKISVITDCFRSYCQWIKHHISGVWLLWSGYQSSPILNLTLLTSSEKKPLVGILRNGRFYQSWIVLCSLSKYLNSGRLQGFYLPSTSKVKIIREYFQIEASNLLRFCVQMHQRNLPFSNQIVRWSMNKTPVVNTWLKCFGSTCLGQTKQDRTRSPVFSFFLWE